MTIDGSTVTITAAGTYVLSGSLSDGEVIVNAPDAEVRLVLDGVDLTNADGAAIDIQDAGDMIVVLADGSSNTLADGATYADTSDDAPTAAFFSSDDMTITGTGSLSVTGNSNDGISSKNGLVITGNTTIDVTAADDGIRGKDHLVIESGTVTVQAGGDGLKASEDNDETEGFVELGAANITITSGDDGVSAVTDITVADTTLNITAGSSSTASTDSPKGLNGSVSVTIDSGTVTVHSDDEGIQAAVVNINGGTIDLQTGDDGLNGSNNNYVIEGYENANSEQDDGSVVTIAGGTVLIHNTGSDGLDSNGSAYITGGLLVVQGAIQSPESAIDVNGNVTANGITVNLSVAVGDTVTITGDGQTRTYTATVASSAITIVGLTSGTTYTVSTGSASATGTASALNNVGGAGGGGQGGPGGMGRR